MVWCDAQHWNMQKQIDATRYIVPYKTDDRMSIIVLRYARRRMRIVSQGRLTLWRHSTLCCDVTLRYAVTWLFTRKTPSYKTYTCQKKNHIDHKLAHSCCSQYFQLKRDKEFSFVLDFHSHSIAFLCASYSLASRSLQHKRAIFVTSIKSLKLWDWTGAGFSNILDYRKTPILIEVLTGNFMQPALRECAFVTYFHFVIKGLNFFNYHRPSYRF